MQTGRYKLKESLKQSIFIKTDERKRAMKKYLTSGLNFGGALLILIGVFVFANSFSGKTFLIAAIKIPGSADAGFLMIALGMILFGLSFVAGKFLKEKS